MAAYRMLSIGMQSLRQLLPFQLRYRDSDDIVFLGRYHHGPVEKRRMLMLSPDAVTVFQKAVSDANENAARYAAENERLREALEAARADFKRESWAHAEYAVAMQEALRKANEALAEARCIIVCTKCNCSHPMQFHHPQCASVIAIRWLAAHPAPTAMPQDDGDHQKICLSHCATTHACNGPSDCQCDCALCKAHPAPTADLGK
jgi:hypothetical protein